MIKPICKDTFFLAQASQEASKDDLYIAEDLQDTLAFHREACLGLAANMIGVNKTVIIISMGFVDLVMFNPTIIDQSKPYQTQEGCLSLSGTRPTQRFEQITVTYLDHNWRKKTLSLTGLAAQVCQHEIDHLKGIII